MAPKKTPSTNKKPPRDNGGRISPEERFLASVKERARRNLKVLRIDTGLTSKDLAEASGIGHSMLKAIEAGNRSLQIHQAFKIAKETGVDISSLMASNTLFEWGGGTPYTAASYLQWIENGKEPSPKQQSQTKALLARKVEQSRALAQRLGPDYEAYLAAYLDLFIDSFWPDGPPTQG